MPPTVNYQLSTVNCPAALPYHSAASVWLSVDPLSDKYPSVSPYVYCANNPVRLVDVDGREVWIDGTAAEWAFSTMASEHPNLNLSMDRYGRLQADVKDFSELTSSEKELYTSITSTEVVVNLTVNNSNNYRHPESGTPLHSNCGAAFMGNKLSDDKCMAFTYQFASKSRIEMNYDAADYDELLFHEITESFKGGVFSLGDGKAAGPAMGNNKNDAYDWAHEYATPQPNLSEEKVDRNTKYYEISKSLKK